MAAPTLTSQAGSTWTDSVNTSEVTASISWNSGDRILVVGWTEDQTTTLGTPTATGLTFSALGTAITTSNSCWMHAWQATAGSAGSGAVTATIATGSGTAMRGIHALAFGDCTGFTRTNGGGNNSTQTVSVTRGQANSAVVFAAADWSAAGTGGLGWTPAGQTQLQAVTGGGATAFAARWGDQGATGTTAYGTTGVAGTSINKFAVEVLGTVSTSTTAPAGNAAVTTTANDPTAVLAVAAATAAAAVSAPDPATVVAAGAGAATVTAAANDPGVAVVAYAEAATVGAVANQPAVQAASTATAPAEAATVAVAANDPGVAVVAYAEAATVGAVAYDATVDSGGDPPVTQSLFTDQTPASTDNSDGAPGIVTATSLVFAAAGEITHVRFRATTTVSGTYTANVWQVTAEDPTGAGTLLASTVMGDSPTPGGWNVIELDTPVEVTPDTVLYRVGVHSSAGRYVATSSYAPFINGAGGITNGDIWAPHTGDNPTGLGSCAQGTFAISATSTVYPTQTFSSGCYFVDVVFAPVAAAETVAPAEVATVGAAANDPGVAVVAYAEAATVGVAANQPSVQASGTATAPAESATVAVAANDPGVAVVAYAEAATVGAAAYDATVDSGTAPTVSSIFTVQVPESTNNSDGAPGIITATTFVAAVDGLIHGIRFYATATVSGTYTGALHQVTAEDDPGPGAGTLLESGVLSGSPAAGAWNVIPLDNPVPVTAGTMYRAAMHSSAGRYVVTPAAFSGVIPVVNGDLTAPGDGEAAFSGALRQGTFEITTTADAYPNNYSNGSCYFVDVTFEETAPTDVVAFAECATVGVTANDALPAVVAAPDTATVAAQALNPSTSGGNATIALAECATVGVAALFEAGTSVSVTLVADAALEVPVAANQPTVAVVAHAECAGVGVTANQPVVPSGAATAPAGVATVAAAANQPAAAVVAMAECAGVGVAALFEAGTSVSVTLVADAALEVPVAANQPTVAVVAHAECAGVGVTANQPVVATSGGGTALAEVAEVTAAANQPTVAVVARAECATVGAVANDATVSTAATTVSAELATVTVAAYDAAPVVGAAPATGTVAAAANQPAAAVVAMAECAGVGVSAYDPLTSSMPVVVAYAECAGVGVAALDPVVTVVQPTVIAWPHRINRTGLAASVRRSV